MSETRTVNVAWTAPAVGITGVRITPVSLTEGYSTEDDIPNILGIFHGYHPDAISIISISEAREI